MVQKPQFTLEQPDIPPFTAKRHYDEDGNVTWIPLERNLQPSGIHVPDHYLQFLMRGGYDRPTFCAQEGIIEFQQRYVLQVADQLLRYTDLSQEHIARHYGGIDGTNLIRLYRSYYHCTPLARRRHLRQPNDEGRYRV